MSLLSKLDRLYIFNMNHLNISKSTSHPLALYKNHLEFNGYQIIEEGENHLFCTHRRKLDLILNSFSHYHGVLVVSIFSFKRTINRSEILEYINDLNSSFLTINAHIDGGNNLIFQSFFQGDYDRTNFSLFLDNIDCDKDIWINKELTSLYFA